MNYNFEQLKETFEFKGYGISAKTANVTLKFAHVNGNKQTVIVDGDEPLYNDILVHNSVIGAIALNLEGVIADKVLIDSGFRFEFDEDIELSASEVALQLKSQELIDGIDDFHPFCKETTIAGRMMESVTDIVRAYREFGVPVLIAGVSAKDFAVTIKAQKFIKAGGEMLVANPISTSYPTLALAVRTVNEDTGEMCTMPYSKGVPTLFYKELTAQWEAVSEYAYLFLNRYVQSISHVTREEAIHEPDMFNGIGEGAPTDSFEGEQQGQR